MSTVFWSMVLDRLVIRGDRHKCHGVPIGAIRGEALGAMLAAALLSKALGATAGATVGVIPGDDVKRMFPAASTLKAKS
jgi:outer membrane lipoprotein SlyB